MKKAKKPQIAVQRLGTTSAKYEKHRRKTKDALSPAEREFLKSIKATQRRLEGKRGVAEEIFGWQCLAFGLKN
jgi:hypothetical protein